MSRTFVPPVGWDQRKQISDAYADWLAEQDVDWWVTLNNNRPAPKWKVYKDLGHWLARLDHQHLGRNWSRCGGERTFAVAVIEHPLKNIHLHLLLRMPTPARTLGRPYQMESMQKHWHKIEPAGQCVQEWIYDIAGVARYMCKELPFSGHLEDCIIISTQFHNYR
jgi:hypothetical protein